MKKLALLAAASLLSHPAVAAGIDSRTINCAELQGLIAAQGFIFISQPVFGDFVVSNSSYCPGVSTNAYLQTRTVPTTDNPQCVVKYCLGRSSGGSAN